MGGGIGPLGSRGFLAAATAVEERPKTRHTTEERARRFRLYSEYIPKQEAAKRRPGAGCFGGALGMTFEHDFLISYAHLDDESLVEGEPGWIAHLHRLLEIRVGQLLGEKTKIWRDP